MNHPFGRKLTTTGHSWPFRLVALTLVASQAVPTFAFADEKPAKPAPTPTPQVVPNRKAPPIIPAPRTPQFSAEPTDAEIARARVFEEPILPLPGPLTPRENVELAHAISARMGSASAEGLSGFETFLRDHPGSRWKGSLLLGMGVVYRRTGYFTRALDSWEQAWGLLKGETDPRLRALADRAIGELTELNARLGRYDRLEQLFATIEGRDVRGPAAEKVSAAREGLAVMQNEPGRAFLCGPYGLDRILASVRKDYVRDPKIAGAKSTRQGTSMRQMLDLADSVGLKMQIARRSPGAAVVVPALVHWKAGHFAALVKDAGDRLLIQDPTFGDELWISRAVLDAEGSGAFLVPAGALPLGWESLRPEDGQDIWGKGFGNGADPQIQGSCSTAKSVRCECVKGMADYTVNLVLVNLHITDAPVGYSPPVGPAMEFRAAYNAREVFQPQLPAYSNLGSKWTFDWFSFVQDDPLNAAQNVDVYLRQGGQETYSGMGSGTSGVHYRSRAAVARTSPTSYERRLPDGSVEVFGQPDTATVFPRRIYLTAIKDPQGNSASLAYSYESTTGGLRLASATDAIGQITTFSYENSDPLKITKVTDPFGRFAQFEYDTSGRLTRITDVIGITSEFTYGASDFISSLTTPYGTTSFMTGQNGVNRWLEATDPLGARERYEFLMDTLAIPTTEPVVPQGMATHNVFLHLGNTFYFDKRAMAAMPMGRDYTKAHIYRWLHLASHEGMASGILDSEKAPLESRVWYSYADQPPGVEGSGATPIAIGRVLDDGTTQLYRYEYNSRGKITKAIDPVGRETVYVYGTNNVPDADPATGTAIDLLQVKQKNGGSYDLVDSRTYNAHHMPLTVTDAAGQTTSFTYNTQGQVLTVVTPPRGGLSLAQRTTTYSYDTNGYLQNIASPLPGATTSFTYDGYGLMRTLTNPDSYALTYDYDALDRPTRTTYPDGTYEETIYSRLDAEKQRDRQGRWTHTFHDALRRVVATRDSLGRTTTSIHGIGCFTCESADADKVVDPNGNTTTWERDLQGRVIREIRADGADWEYAYENTTSRLKQRKDAKDQIAAYEYFLDSRLEQITYTSAVVATPNVSFTYDLMYGRRATMTDGVGTTTYAYHPITTTPALGAGQLANVDGPLTNDTVSYTYDELGRSAARGLATFTSSFAFDALGRLTTQGSPVGSFTITYDGTTGRPLTVTYPNGQTTQYTYFPNSSDRRLQQIKHLAPGGGTISKYDYTYSVVGNIATWSQQIGANPAKVHTLGYDAADQLTTAKVTGPNPLPVPSRFAYAYDATGNRTAEQLDDAVLGASYNNRNQLVSRQPGGALLFRGSVNEPASVNVQGKAASVGSDNAFSGQAQVPSGTSNVVVTATDPTGNTRTNTYQLSETGASTAYTYDLNGNLTGDGTKTYEWDAENRLVAVKQGGTTLASFAYDGDGRRVQKVAGGLTTSYIHDGNQMIEERRSTGGTLSYVHGLSIDQHLAQRDGGGVVTYFLSDHLGSVVQATSAAGIVTVSREYDSYGNVLSGASQSGYAFTGREWDSEAGLYYYRARYYDAKTARFLSKDPIGLRGGINRYGYVANDPTNRRDPTGHMGAAGWGAGITVVVITIWTLRCVRDVQTQVTGWQNPFMGPTSVTPQWTPPDPSNRVGHCIAECLITRQCPGGSATAAAAGFIQDPPWAEDQDMDDRKAGGAGRSMAKECPKRNCYDLCFERQQAGGFY